MQWVEFTYSGSWCVSCLARMIVVLQSQHGPDTTFDDLPFAAWSLIEASLGTVVACLSHLSPLIVRSTPGKGWIGYTISSPIASRKVTPRMSGWAHLLAQNQTDQNDLFDDPSSACPNLQESHSKSLRLTSASTTTPDPGCTREMTAFSPPLVLRVSEAQMDASALR